MPEQVPCAWIEVPLRRLTICACGHPVLNESITVGTVYRVWPASRRGGFTYYCGGCRRRQTGVEIIDASSVLFPERQPRPLPAALFDEEPGNG